MKKVAESCRIWQRDDWFLVKMVVAVKSILSSHIYSHSFLLSLGGNCQLPLQEF